ncbi:hypothetical protein [Streptomyces atriruber]|uniref:hypothetical protein n=1 Tax=Streptomyces atriruber TaxID=545121 RepID=UPI0006E21267|nr:hypothetical protein [Streptomyces atriruber]
MSHDLRKIMVLGSGDIGRRVFHELAHSRHKRHVELVGRDEEALLRTTNMTRFCGLQRGFSPTVSHSTTDLVDVERTAERIAAFRPDVLFLSASYQSWWVISTLPQDAFQRLYAANYGPWLPMHLVPVMKAMEAVKLSGIEPVVVNAAYPDAVHPALASVGLSPDVGIGNVANNVPGLQAVAADHLACAPDDVEVRLIAHHYVSHRLSRRGDSGRARMSLAVLHRGSDITAELDIPGLLRRLPTEYRRTGGMAGQGMTAASALSVLEPLVNERDAFVHAPGPNGLLGGYPVAIESDKIRLRLPEGMSQDEALAINVSGQRQDGIAEIRPDGTVVFESSAMDIMSDELGYDCPEMPLTDAEGRAQEIAERFAAYRLRAAA